MSSSPPFALDRNISEPVILASIEVLQNGSLFFLRTTSQAGVTGIAVANKRLPHLLSLFKALVVPYFIGKDVRDLASLIHGVGTTANNYKYSSLPFWNAVGVLETSLLDLLGKTAHLPVAALLGPVLRSELPIYLSSVTRETSPEEEVETLLQRVAETGAIAVKIKIGGRMLRTESGREGRTQALIELVSQKLAGKVQLFADANGSYTSDQAIEVGRRLDAHGFSLFEEPCPWEDFEETKRVADALKLQVAGGEQDTSMAKIRWMIRERAVDVFQPDIYNIGGFHRSLEVARIAEAAGMNITPHSSAEGPRALPKLHFSAIVKNLEPHVEFDARNKSGEGWFWPAIKVTHGVLQLPTGEGLGVDYDPAILKAAVRL
jgi:L-alanine-DL-glutamate epimerase-like enolase superfamily enzyme